MRLRRWVWRVGGGLLSLLTLVVAVAFVSLRYFLPRSPISAEPSEEVRRGEDARLAGMGLVPPVGGLVLAHPSHLRGRGVRSSCLPRGYDQAWLGGRHCSAFAM